MDIQVFHKQGLSIRKIALELNISRNSVRKYLRNAQTPPSYQTRTARSTKLDPFKAYLTVRIKAADPQWIPAPVLYREILSLGYTGKLRSLNYYLSRIRPVKTADSLVRFETEPGHQLQVDFTIIRRNNRPLKALVATLGYSRTSFVKFYDNERSESWLDGIKQAFAYFGGVTREVLFDNARAIILERDAYGEGLHRWNPKLLELANAYGYT